MKKAIILLANGFEEIEAITPIDLLRRADIEVLTLKVKSQEDSDDLIVTGSRGIKIIADSFLKDSDIDFNCIIIPGGLDGAENLASNSIVNDLLKKCFYEKILIAAICAAPAIVLYPLGLLKDSIYTCYPGFEDNIKDATYSLERIVLSNGILTSKGAGAAAELSYYIIQLLLDKNKASSVFQTTMQHEKLLERNIKK